MRILCLGGGGLRGAFQVPILEALLAEHEYDLILGISSGAMNGALVAQGDVERLRPAWESTSSRDSLRGVPGAYALSRHPWRGAFTLGPLRRRLRNNVRLDRIRTPFGCGVVVRETHQYRLLMAADMTEDRQLHDAVVASGAIAGLFPPVTWRDPAGTWTASDGGHRHNVPPVPKSCETRVRHVDAIFTAPLRLPPARAHGDLVHSVAWAFESYLELTRLLDVERLRKLRDARGVTLGIYAPSRPTGGILDAHPETIRARLHAGEEALRNPLKL